jgi:RHS repeat-associated protein
LNLSALNLATETRPGAMSASASDVIAEYLWLSPDAANDNQPFGGDDGINGYAPLAISSAPTGGTAQIVWVHGNHMGVPLTYTNTTGAEISPPSFTQSAFPGQMKTLPDLYYNRYRDYDPTTGRYIQADPIGLAGDPNPYAYAMNNPLRYSDPTGQCPWCVPIAIGIALGGAEGALIDLAQQFYNGTSAGCINWNSVGSSAAIGGIAGGAIGGAAPLIARGISAIGKRFAGGLSKGLGDLTKAETKQIQKAVNSAGRPLDVVGSAAQGTRRGVGSNLPIGKGPGTKSDIDFTTANANFDNFNGIKDRLPNIDPNHGLLRGPADPAIGPSIRFEPKSNPKFVPGK